jgi:hypothetical protein
MQLSHHYGAPPGPPPPRTMAATTPPPVQWRPAERGGPAGPTGWIGGTTARQPCAPWMPRTRPSACPWGSTLGELPGHVYIIIYEISPICGEVHWEMPSACSPGVLFIRARTSGYPLHIYEIISSKDSYYVRSGLGKYENHANFCLFPHGYLYFPRARKCTKI